jgi:hypothetical protein
VRSLNARIWSSPSVSKAVIAAAQDLFLSSFGDIATAITVAQQLEHLAHLYFMAWSMRYDVIFKEREEQC